LENIEEVNITYLIIIGCFGMLILAISIILFIVLYNKRVLLQKHQIQAAKFNHQKELIEATIQVEENEREKISKNIHDDLGALLNVIRLNNMKAIKNANKPEVVVQSLEDNKSLLNSTSEIVRSVAKQLAPPTLLKLGYVEGIKELCKQVNNTGAIKVEFKGDKIAVRFQQRVEVQLYRVTQEVVNNILKHAKASSITIELKLLENMLTLTVSHDGLGISADTIKKLMRTSKGLGLKSIQTRIQTIKGSIQYFSIGTNDSKIIIHIPVIK
jgi:signal transduction histidine kinase